MAVNPLKLLVARLAAWDSNPLDAFVDAKGRGLLPGLASVLIVLFVLFSIGLTGTGQMSRQFAAAFLFVFLLAVLAFLLAGQKVVKHYNLEYALWCWWLG